MSTALKGCSAMNKKALGTSGKDFHVSQTLLLLFPWKEVVVSHPENA